MLFDELYDELSAQTRPSSCIKKIILNGGFTGVILDDDSMGLAMNVRSGACSTDEDKSFFLGLIGQEALTAYGLLMERRIQSVAGSHRRFMLNSVLAALGNALSSPALQADSIRAEGFCLAEVTPQDLVGPADTVTIVGYGGMVRSLSAQAQKCYVTELEPEVFYSWMFSDDGLVKGPHCTEVVSALESEKYISRSNKVFITGCALVTDTLEELLMLSQGKEVYMYGYTASILPRLLFSHGVTGIHTVRVTAADKMADVLMNCGGAAERFIPQASQQVFIGCPGFQY